MLPRAVKSNCGGLCHDSGGYFIGRIAEMASLATHLAEAAAAVAARAEGMRAQYLVPEGPRPDWRAADAEDVHARLDHWLPPAAWARLVQQAQRAAEQALRVGLEPETSWAGTRDALHLFQHHVTQRAADAGVRQLKQSCAAAVATRRAAAMEDGKPARAQRAGLKKRARALR